MIITDQQRAEAVGYRTPWLKTPNLDRLQQTATDYQIAYTQSPQCQPSRASILTGRYPTAHRVWWNETPFPASELTIANHFRQLGYETAIFGKAHITPANATEKEDQILDRMGFNPANNYTETNWHSLTDVDSHYHVAARSALKQRHGLMKAPMWTGRLDWRAFQHEEIITDRAISFLENSTTPTFTIVSYVGPHPPYAAPKPFSELYQPEMFSDRSPEWQQLLAQYYGSISWIDDCVGRILGVIDFDQTLIVFLSDHGDILGDHGLFSKGLYTYEGNTRIPLLIKAPGQSTPKAYTGLAQAIDVFPTVCGLLGISVPAAVQGIDLEKTKNEWALSMIGGQKRIRMIRVDDYKYTIDNEGQEQSFNLDADPRELTPLHPTDQLRHWMLKALIAAEDRSL